MYSGASSSDKCTLYSDRNLINRRNVKTRVDSAVKAAHSFFDLCVKARVIAAALEVMKIGSIDDNCDQVPNAQQSNAAKREYISKLAGQIVDEYVLNTTRNGELAKSIAELDVSESQPVSQPESKQDDVLSYQKALMEYGLLLFNYKDAINEGDGERNIRCWKFFLLHLRHSKRSTKYALEALYMMFQANALLSPKAAHDLIWNRSVKLRRGGNIPLDLQLEFFNRLLKDAVKQLGPNATQRSMDRICKSISVTKDLMDRFDAELNIHKCSGKHVAKSAEQDLKKIVQQLMEQKAMLYQQGRVYQYYHGIKSSFLWDIDIQDLHKWINNHRKYIEIRRRPV